MQHIWLNQTSNSMEVSSDIFWNWGTNSEILSWQVKETVK